MYYIKWNDACEFDLQDDFNLKDCVQEACGFLVKKDRYNYVLARDFNSINEQYERCLRIPKDYVLEVYELLTISERKQ